ncbi:TMEM43 family protein [Candidatus Halobeggiatoa sp. HSG11]|nr:TMEM43 family protein [Candidatus Halobeggiatoa sp. HSG11]
MATLYTDDTSKQSWNAHTKDYFKNIVFGTLLLSFSFMVLFWNEGNVISQIQTLEEAEQEVVSIDANQVDLFNEGKLIHLSGPAITNEILIDEIFKIDANDVIKLRRIVEMYQWQERQHPESKGLLGGKGTITMTYIYDKVWSSEYINSKKKFKHFLNHKNPPMPMKGKEFIAEHVNLGEFTLSTGIVKQFSNYQHLPIENFQIQGLQDISDNKVSLKFGDFYIGKDPAYNPQIGDLRVRFEIVPPTTVSIIAKQSDSDLIPYQTRAAGKIELFEYGTVDAETMFKHARIFNNNFIWFLRLVGFLLVFVGLGIIFQVFRILATVMPFFNSVINYFTWFAAFTFALTFTFDTIAAAWLYYRPLAAIILMLISLVFLFILKGMQNITKPKEKNVQQPVAPQPMSDGQRAVMVPSGHAVMVKPGLTPEAAVPIK